MFALLYGPSPLHTDMAAARALLKHHLSQVGSALVVVVLEFNRTSRRVYSSRGVQNVLWTTTCGPIVACGSPLLPSADLDTTCKAHRMFLSAYDAWQGPEECNGKLTQHLYVTDFLREISQDVLDIEQGSQEPCTTGC